jgi:hypothetical protein
VFVIATKRIIFFKVDHDLQAVWCKYTTSTHIHLLESPPLLYKYVSCSWQRNQLLSSDKVEKYFLVSESKECLSALEFWCCSELDDCTLFDAMMNLDISNDNIKDILCDVIKC